MFELKDVKRTLEGLDNGSELISVIDNTINSLSAKVEAEKRKGIEATNKRNKENEGLRKYKTAVKTLGYDSEELELDDFVSNVSSDLSNFKKVSKDGGGLDFTATPQYKELNKQLRQLTKNSEKMTAELEAEKERAKQLKIRNQNSTIKSTLLKTLNDKMIGVDLVADNLINSGKVKLDEDEKTIVFADGESVIDFDDGIKNLLEERKDLLKNQQHAGGGSAGDGGSGKKDSSIEEKKEWVKNYLKR